MCYFKKIIFLIIENISGNQNNFPKIQTDENTGLQNIFGCTWKTLI